MKSPKREDVANSIVTEVKEDDPAKSAEIQDAAKESEELDHKEHLQIIAHRDKFADHAYGLTQAWVGFLIVITIAQIALKPLDLGLSETAFVTVFTTTTAAVFGFGVLVGNFLFPKGGSGKRRG